MTFWLKMALASAASRKWILAISLISIGISSAVILSVAQIRADVRNSFASAINGVDLIVGSRDSPTELLMYTVFGLGQASRSMPFSTAQTIAELPGVAWVIPIQLGDFYNDSPVMGTESSFFKLVQVATLAATGSARAGRSSLLFANSGAHGLVAGLATGGPTGPPGI